MTRSLALLVVLAGCDQVYNLHRPPGDASVGDGGLDTPDVAPGTCDFGPASSPHAIAPAKGTAIVAGPFDLDATVDIAVAMTTSTAISIYANEDGTGSFTSRNNIDVGVAVLAMAPGDINTDSDVDIAFAGAGRAGALLQTTGPGWTPVSSAIVNNPASSISIASLDTVGLLDLLVAVPSSNQIQLVYGGATYAPGGALTRTGKHPTGSVPLDVDGDTDIDVVVTTVSDENGVVIYRDNGASFTTGPLLATGTSPVALAAGTLGNRPVPDIVVVNAGSDNISLLRNDGVGNFIQGTNFDVQDMPVAVLVADVTLDGLADILVLNNKSNSFSVFRGTEASFEVRQDYPTVDKPVAFAVGDFTGDGHTDLAVLGEDAGFVIHTQACAPP